jgi:hypothetical protein
LVSRWKEIALRPCRHGRAASTAGDPAINALADVDARHEAGHDGPMRLGLLEK